MAHVSGPGVIVKVDQRRIDEGLQGGRPGCELNRYGRRPSSSERVCGC